MFWIIFIKDPIYVMNSMESWMTLDDKVDVKTWRDFMDINGTKDTEVVEIGCFVLVKVDKGMLCRILMETVNTQ